MAAATVSSAGGQVVTDDGSLAVQIPAGALDKNVKVTVESTTAPAAGSVGTVFEIGPTGTQFKQPVKIALKFGQEDAADLRVATYADGAWQVLPNYVLDAEHHTIAGDTMHLSPYALVRMTCVPVAASGGCDTASSCPKPTCANLSCNAYPGAQLSCMEMPEGAAGSCCFAPGAQMCATRSIGCSGTSAPDASGTGGTGGSGASSAVDAGTATLSDAGVKADAPPPEEPPPADMPPKEDAFAPPPTDAGLPTGSADGGVPESSDAGVRTIDEPEKLPEPTCSKPTCDTSVPCGGVPGAMRSSCKDTEFGIDETCCYAADKTSDAPNTSTRDGGTDVGSGGSGGAGSSAPVAAGDAGVPAPDEPKPDAGTDTGTGGSGSGAEAGTGGASGGADAPVPQPKG